MQLFAPLAGIEVLYARCEGSVLVVGVSLSVNLASLTIEQVLHFPPPHHHHPQRAAVRRYKLRAAAPLPAPATSFSYKLQVKRHVSCHKIDDLVSALALCRSPPNHRHEEL